MVALFVDVVGASGNIHLASGVNTCILATLEAEKPRKSIVSGKLRKWDDAYQNADIGSALPARVLEENAFLLPGSGEALDLACGRGGNALFLARLAQSDFQVDAVDFSPVVLNSLSIFAEQNQLAIRCHLRDIESNGLMDKQYDVIVVSYFLCRDLFPAIIGALKPGGLLFYQTWSQQRVDDSGPNNPEFRLEPGELLKFCDPLSVVYYRENGTLGDTKQGLRNEAMLVARNV